MSNELLDSGVDAAPVSVSSTVAMSVLKKAEPVDVRFTRLVACVSPAFSDLAQEFVCPKCSRFVTDVLQDQRDEHICEIYMRSDPIRYFRTEFYTAVDFWREMQLWASTPLIVNV